MSAEAPRRARLGFNAIANAAGNLSFFAVVFFLTPMAIRHLGEDGWGIWQLVGAATAYAALLNLGLGVAVHYQVAFRSAQSDWEGLAVVYTNVRLYLIASAALILALLALLGRPLVASLVDPDQQELAHAALCLTVGITALTLPFRIYPSTLAGLQRLDIYGAIQIIAGLLVLAVVWVGFERDMSLLGFAAIMTLGPVLPTLPSWWTAHRLLPRAALRWTRPDGAGFRQLVAYSLSSLLYSVGAVILYQTMKFLAAWQCGGAEAAGRMGLVISIVQMMGVVFTPILVPLIGRFGQLHGEGKMEAIGDLLERSLIVTGALLIPGIAFLLMDTPVIYDAWVGAEVGARTVSELSWTARVMFLGQAAFILALPCYYALLGIGEHRAFGFAMLVAAVANAALGWVASEHAPEIGTLGVVFSVVTTALAFGVTMPLALRRFPVSLGRLAGAGLLWPALASLPGLAVLNWRPAAGHPILELAVDALIFAALTLPGLEWLRRRHLRSLPAE